MSYPEDQAQSDAPSPNAPQNQSQSAPYSAAPLAQSAPVQEPAQISEAGRFTGVLFSPGETFADVNRKPTWIVPLVLVLICAMGFFWFLFAHFEQGWHQFLQKTLEDQAQQSGSPPPTPQKVDQAVMGTKWFFVIGFGFVITALATLASAGALALGMMFMQAQTTFKKIFSVVLWSWAGTSVLKTIITIVSVYVRGQDAIDNFKPSNISSLSATNLAAFLPEGTSGFVKALVAAFDVFSIWYLILLMIGLAAVSGTRKIKPSSVAPMVVGLWLVTIVILAALFGR